MDENQRMIENAVVITIGTGIGGGVICNGKLVTGTGGAAGEIGHMPVAPDHPLLQRILEHGGDIRSSADLEYYVSANGIARMANAWVSVLKETDAPAASADLLPEDSPDPGTEKGLHLTEKNRSPLTEKEGSPLTAKDVFDASKNGDPTAVEITDFFFDTLGKALASVASVTDPDVFIIGGGVSAAGDHLLDGLRSSYRKYVFHAMTDTEFRLAVMGNDAGLYGCIAACMLA